MIAVPLNMTDDFTPILAEAWPKIRKRHLFPELPAPCFEDSGQHAAIDLRDKKIFLSLAFARDISSKIAPHTVVEGFLDHAVSHYMYCPWNLSTHLKLYAESKKILKDKQMAQKAADAFMDVAADTRCISNTDSPLPQIYRHLHGGMIEEIIKALYQNLWGKNMGSSGYDEISNKLSLLPYLDRRRWIESIRRFSALLRPFLEAEKDRQALDQPLLMGTHGIAQYTKEEIHQGLKEFAKEMPAPSDFTDIVEDFKEDLSRALGDFGQGIGSGSEKSVAVEPFYYMKLAENFWLPVKKIPMKGSGSVYPHHHTPWEVGRPCQDIDPWTSFGKIMPGISQTWERKEGEIFGKEESTPNCMVLIDSSSSMIDPRRYLSYSVLGAACACDAYLRNGAAVAVYNFSDARSGGREILPYTENRWQIYHTLCRYIGGGTRLVIEDIESLQTSQTPDIFLITDMQITNLKTLIAYFNTCKNRITTVHVGNNEQVHMFRKQVDLRKKIGIYPVEKKEDIPRIVLGKVREYLYKTSFFG